MGDLKRDIIKLDEKYKDSDFILGKELLTLANRINSSRANMASSEHDQIVNLITPDVAGVCTNYENLIGKYSSGYLKMDDDYKVIDKIVKYPWSTDSVYVLIVKNKRTKKYNIIMKKHGEELTETYGYKFQTENMDTLEPGDKIEKDEVLFRSTSFDEHMNYRLGVEVPTLYCTDPMSIEDGIIISDELAERTKHIEYDRVYISQNDNDIFINWYGNKKYYKAFPDIGEHIKNSTVAIMRRIDYSRVFYDLKDDNISKQLSSDTPFYLPFSNDKVVDINIYCNKDSIDDIPDTPYNEQILKYLRAQETFYKSIVEKLQPIIDDKKYEDDLSELYSRAIKIIDPEYKWSDQSKRVFGNIKIEFLVEKVVNTCVGAKYCGRYGDKGVITEIRKKKDMPFYYDDEGNKIYADCLVNILGVGNRLNLAQLYEQTLNWCKACLIEQLQHINSHKIRKEKIFRFLELSSQSGYKKFKKFYNKQDEAGKKELIDDMVENGFSVEQPPLYGNIDLDRFSKMFEEFTINETDAYVYKWGRKKKLLNKVIIADKYMYKLKHHQLSGDLNSFNCLEELMA